MNNIFFRITKVLVILAALCIFPKPVSASPAGHVESPLPIETITSIKRSSIRVTTFTTSNRLYIGVTARLPFWVSMHADFQLIGRSGRVLAEKRDTRDLPTHPSTAWRRAGRQRYVASFPLSEMRRAAKIRVIVHGAKHEKN